MLIGVLEGIAAGALWGLIYIAPLMLPDYSPVLIALSRFIMFGFVSLPFIFVFRKELKKFTRADVMAAFKLPLIGNVIFYCLLAMCIRLAGAPLAGMLMALIPVLVAIASNFRYSQEGRALSWGVILPPLAVIFAGLVIANWSEFQYITAGAESPLDFWAGAGFGVAAIIAWTWFSIMNGEWLLGHPTHDSTAWTALQGVTVLPVVLAAFAVFAYPLGFMDAAVSALGPTPWRFCLVALMIGILCSWAAMYFWNAMSQRLPSALGGQLIVFESISSVIYALIWRGEWPPLSMVGGFALLLAGVLGSLYVFRHAGERLEKKELQGGKPLSGSARGAAGAGC